MTKFKKIKDLNIGYNDAENYRRREEKTSFLKKFLRTTSLDSLLEPKISFLVGEKGVGKTAYAVFLAHSDYKRTISCIKYVRETEFEKFLQLKKKNGLDLSGYTDVWKVIILMLIAYDVIERGKFSDKSNKNALQGLHDTIAQFNKVGFSPEILQAIRLVENSAVTARITSDWLEVDAETAKSSEFTESNYQLNLLIIQRNFMTSLGKLKLDESHLLFIDGIDIRPHGIEYEDYLGCIKGLASAVWSLNQDFFSSIRDSKGRMRVVMLVRPDIYDRLGLQNQNTKLRNNSVVLDWRATYVNYRNSELFKLIDQLLQTQQENNTLILGDTWDHYFPFNAPGQDAHDSFIWFLRFSYSRPRDVITAVEMLIERAPEGAESFDCKCLHDTEFLRDYSNYLLGEVKDQILFYHTRNEYESFLRFFKFLGGKNQFSYDEYIHAHTKYCEAEKRRNVDTGAFLDADGFLQFLYDLNVISYKEKIDMGVTHIHWCYRDRSYANISPSVKVDAEYQVFYGLYKALDFGRKVS